MHRESSLKRKPGLGKCSDNWPTLPLTLRAGLPREAARFSTLLLYQLVVQKICKGLFRRQDDLTEHKRRILERANLSVTLLLGLDYEFSSGVFVGAAIDVHSTRSQRS